ncbi:MAG: formylglycine-generating enzyme family protein [Opitutales bacterium]
MRRRLLLACFAFPAALPAMLPPMPVSSQGMAFRLIPGLEDVRMAIYETRKKDFAAFVAATGYDATEGMVSLRADAFDWAPNGDTWQDPGYAQNGDHPVVGVSLKDARAFCAWLTRHDHATGDLPETHEYRLPTDREWSRAAGLAEETGDTPEARLFHSEAAYPWGETWPPPAGYGNYAGEESQPGKPSWWGTIPGGYADAFPRTAPVGSFPPNEHGFYDLSGNVWEWVDTPYTKTSLAYVTRGGCWGSDRPAYLLLARRNTLFPEARNDETGFRIVRAPAASPGRAAVPGGRRTPGDPRLLKRRGTTIRFADFRIVRPVPGHTLDS